MASLGVEFSFDQIRRIFESTKTIAVVGLSPDPFRPSNDVAQYLQSHGFRIIPVNPQVENVLGEKAYPDLRSVPDRGTEASSELLALLLPEANFQLRK